MLVLILPSCTYFRWFPYWFHHTIGLVIDAYNGRWHPYWFRGLAIITLAVDARTDFVVLPSLLLPLMLVLILPSCNSSRSFPCWLHHIIGLVADARGSSLASLFSPLMPVLISSSFSYCSVIIINCSWCSCWLCSIIARVVGVHADFITSLILQIVVEE